MSFDLGDIGVRKFVFNHGALLAFALMSSTPVFASDLPSLKDAPALPSTPGPAPSDWRFEATIPLWAANLISNVGVGRHPAASANVGFFTLLRHLDGEVPLTLTARNDNFIAGLDFLWFRVSANAQLHSAAALAVPGGVNADLQLSEMIATGFGGVRLPVQISNLSLYGIAGARFFNVNAKLGLDAPVAGLGLWESRDRNWVDPIVGLNAHDVINDKWFANAETDIGGCNQSVTWQAFGALGYNWTQSISTTVGFRALYVYYQKANNNNGSFRFQETILGPQATISYAF